MFIVNDDMSIYVTRGDTVFFKVSAERDGSNYIFRPGEVVRITVTEKKASESVVLQKDFPITEATESVQILLTGEETKFGEVISKPTDYWYEIELNPFDNPQTILGYDEDGAKIIKLFPEGGDLVPEEEEEPETEPGESGIEVDPLLDMTSVNPVQNQAVSRAIAALQGDLDSTNARFNAMATLPSGSTTGDAELADIRAGADGKVYGSAGVAVREQVKALHGRIDTEISTMVTMVEDAVEVITSKEHDFDTPIAEAMASAEKAAEYERGAKAQAEVATLKATEASEYANNAKKVEEVCLDALDEVRKKTYDTQFHVDFSNGHILIDSPSFEFNVNNKGHLEWGVR